MKKILLIMISIIALYGEDLKLYNVHTEEKIDIKIKDGKILNKKETNKFFRDYRKNQVIDMDNKVIMNLYNIAIEEGFIKERIDIISGYRNDETNRELRKEFKNTIAKKSSHAEGKGIDFSIKGNLKELYSRIEDMELGGVGYYSKDNFIHIDSGRKRSWEH